MRTPVPIARFKIEPGSVSLVHDRTNRNRFFRKRLSGTKSRANRRQFVALAY